jgi:Ring finger domain
MKIKILGCDEILKSNDPIMFSIVKELESSWNQKFLLQPCDVLDRDGSCSLIDLERRMHPLRLMRDKLQIIELKIIALSLAILIPSSLFIEGSSFTSSCIISLVTAHLVMWIYYKIQKQNLFCIDMTRNFEIVLLRYVISKIECPICLEDIDFKSSIVGHLAFGKVAHAFHSQCIEKIISFENVYRVYKCPLCIKKIIAYPIFYAPCEMKEHDAIEILSD